MSFTSLPINKKRISQLNDSEKALLSAYMGFTDPDTGKIITSLFPDPVIAELRTGTKDELDNAIPPLLGNEPAWESDTNSLRVGSSVVGGGLASSENYKFITPDDDIIQKYDEAKITQPNGQPLSHTNRITIFLLPGVYGLTGNFTMDADFVDIVGLQDREETIIDVSGTHPDPIQEMSIFAIDVIVKNVTIRQRSGRWITVGSYPEITGINKLSGFGQPITFPVDQNLPPVNVNGYVVRFTSAAGDNNIDLTKRYIYSRYGVGGLELGFSPEPQPDQAQEFATITTLENASFIVEYNPRQRFINVHFDRSVRAVNHLTTISRISGNYNHCQLFGVEADTLSGRLENCSGSFVLKCSGWFLSCEGHFGISANDGIGGGNLVTTGVFIDCKGEVSRDQFTGNIYDGYFYNFQGSLNSFSGTTGGELRGRFINCTGGFWGSTITGVVAFCRTFNPIDVHIMPVSGSGKVTYCVDSVGSPVNRP